MNENKRATRRRRARALAVVGVLSVMTFGACKKPVSDSLPPELLGRWVTSEPMYADRYMELQPDKVIFGTGEAAEEGQITFIRQQFIAGTSRYDIDYVNPNGGELSVVIYFLPMEQTVELKSRPGVRWKKRLTLGGSSGSGP